MKVPFTKDQFFAVFTMYNQAIWPVQILLIAAAVAVLILIALRRTYAGRTAVFFTSALWLWAGIVYHWLYFRPINPAATIFSAFFVIQAVLLCLLGFSSTWTMLWSKHHPNAIVGWLLVAYALAIYPLLGGLFGHPYPSAPTFGAPCPITIFTFGILLMLPRAPWWVFVIPALWAIVGFNAALSFTVFEDYGLLLSAVLAIGSLVVTKKSRSRVGSTT
ncbi:MAG TPA: DUF6064 family protein [Candidatus Kapabacteria bacterium]|nr:DUF6064 family protein [Candidatus Kapabacteria bacterium]